MNKLKEGYRVAGAKEEECTTIRDGMGNLHKGVLCSGCSKACPYWVTDVNDRMACYMDTFCECVSGRMYGEG